MIDAAAVEALDQADPLAHKRKLFQLPAGTIYLDGNSLGALPLAALERAQTTIQQQWGEDLINSWNSHGWFLTCRGSGWQKASGL